MNIETTDREALFEKFKEHYLSLDLSYLRKDIRYDLNYDPNGDIHVPMDPVYSGEGIKGIRAMIKDKLVGDMTDEFGKFCSLDISDYLDEIYDFAYDFVQENIEIDVRFTK